MKLKRPFRLFLWLSYGRPGADILTEDFINKVWAERDAAHMRKIGFVAGAEAFRTHPTQNSSPGNAARRSLKFMLPGLVSEKQRQASRY